MKADSKCYKVSAWAGAMKMCINTDAGVAGATREKAVVWKMNVPQMFEGTWAGAQCW